jgi:hypothetical protein
MCPKICRLMILLCLLLLLLLLLLQRQRQLGQKVSLLSKPSLQMHHSSHQHPLHLLRLSSSQLHPHRALSKLKDGARPVAEAHGKKWYSPDDIDGLKHVKETVEKAWYMDDAYDHHIGPKMPPPATPITHLHAYMLMMPPDQLEMELKLMNANLTSKKKQETTITMGELLKFYGICIFITH